MTDLLHLELDGGFDFLHLSSHGFTMADHGRELSGLVQTWTEDSGDLLDEGVRSKEGIILLGCYISNFKS